MTPETKAAFEKVVQEAQESNSVMESAISILQGVAEILRNESQNAIDETALRASMVDVARSLDDKQLELAEAITTNTVAADELRK